MSMERTNEQMNELLEGKDGVIAVGSIMMLDYVP